ncbi:MAG TPA: hypothetical protein PLY86_18480 [bacterium]|nr:hypothetical protein [bacterium]
MFRPTRCLLARQLEQLELFQNWSLSYSGTLLEEVCDRYAHDMERIPAADLFKQAAHLSFWIKKLKPILAVENTPLHINELFAFLCGQAVLKSHYGPDLNLMKRTYNETLYSLRYRFVSPQTLIILYKMYYR